MSDQTWHKSTCMLCESNCGVEIRVEDGRFTRIRGNKAHVGSKGYTCEKALRLDHYQNNNGRISTPMRRRSDGTHEPIDWDTAIGEIAEKLSAIRDDHGGDKIFAYGGGGQGNHLGGFYGRGLNSALGVAYRSNAIAQEKTGEAFVEARLYYAHTRGDIEHTEVAVFLGKNPWQSHGFPEARRVLKEIANDPNRALVVIDPVRTRSAELADHHLAVRPGTDAFCVAALLAILVRDDLVDHEFVRDHVADDVESVLEVIGAVPIEDYAARCGIPVADLEAVAHRIGRAESCTVFEDLGIEQGPHSTVVSYLQRLIWILQGSWAKPGGMFPHSSLAVVVGGGGGGGGGGANGGGSGKASERRREAPVTGTRIIAGLVACNSIANEILTDHPDRFRAMLIDSVNPAHSLADSARFREAMEALDFTMVIDVAMTETARLADYVLPASSQFEKPECVFFTHEFPNNVFTLRKPVVPPLEGTLPEPEIYSRLLEALGAYTEDDLAPLRAALEDSRGAFADAVLTLMVERPEMVGLLPSVLYRTLGPSLPDGLAGAAALWGLAHSAALQYPDAVARAGFADGEALFEEILRSDDGVIFTRHLWDEAWDLTGIGEDRKIRANIAMLLDLVRELPNAPHGYTTDTFPLVLAAGERRSFTANTIIRDPNWRKQDQEGALSVSQEDADRLGLADGERVRVVTRAGSAETPIRIVDAMQAGHISLPNGLGLEYPDEAGEHRVHGVAPNELTEIGWEDEIALTPWHKHVPARIEKLTTV